MEYHRGGRINQHVLKKMHKFIHIFMFLFRLALPSPGRPHSQIDGFNFSFLKDMGFEEMDFDSLADACRQTPIKSLLESDSKGNTLWHSFARKVGNNSTELKEIIRKSANEVLLKAVENVKTRSTILHILASNPNSHETLLDILDEFLPGEKDTRMLTQQNGKGQTIFHILSETAKEVASLRNLEYVMQLYTNVRIESPLNLAIMSSNTQAAKLLMDNDYKLTTGLNALQSSIKYNNPDLVKYVLQKFPEFRLQLDKRDASPLHYAVNLSMLDRNATSEGIEEYKKLRMEILKVLLEHDVSDAEHQNYEEDNCLHAAISSGFPEAAMIVIHHLQQLEGNERKQLIRKKSPYDWKRPGRTCTANFLLEGDAIWP